MRVFTEREPPLGLLTSGLGKIYAAGPLAEGGAWLLARNRLWRWQTGAATPVSDDVARLLGADSVVCGSALGDGTFALGTRAHGLLIVDSDGRVLARYGEDTARRAWRHQSSRPSGLAAVARLRQTCPTLCS